MVLGGNDCFERSEAQEVPQRFTSALALLVGKMGVGMSTGLCDGYRPSNLGESNTLQELTCVGGVRAVCVGAYPEGHPGLEFDHAVTEVRRLMESSFTYILCCDFC